MVNFNLNGNNISQMVNPYLTIKELLDFIFYRTNDNLMQKVDNRFFVVMLDLKLVYSRLIPAFILDKRNLITIEGLKGQNFYTNMQKILLEADFNFCDNCFESNVLMFYFFIRNKIISKSDILGYRTTLKCSCTDVNTFLDLYLKIEELHERNN